MNATVRTIEELEVKGKRVLLRADLNVPMQDDKIEDDTRLKAILPSLDHLRENGAKVILLSHFGRPKGKVVAELRLDPIAEALSKLAGVKILKLDECIGDKVEAAVSKMNDGDVILLENTRFHPEEKENDEAFAKKLADLGDIFVNDAFGAIHRAHASTVGIAKHLPSYAGFLVAKEIEALGEVLKNPERPVCLIIGGAKIDTKIGVLEKFLNLADYFLIGGALANTFLAAEGYEVGASLCEHGKIEVAQEFLLSAESKKELVYIPLDVIVADEISENVESLDVKLEDISLKMKILDIGSLTIETFVKCIKEAGTIIWNGPMGLYEYSQFEKGTREVAEAVAESDAVTIIGGGDTIDAINNFGIDLEKFTHISMGGGAMIEFLEGKKLPGLEVLMG